MNGLQKWIFGIVGTLAAAGVISSINVYAQQQVTKNEVLTLKEQAKASEETQRQVTILVTKFEAFLAQYEKDQGRGRHIRHGGEDVGG